jgi:hypothetical protein
MNLFANLIDEDTWLLTHIQRNIGVPEHPFGTRYFAKPHLAPQLAPPSVFLYPN